MDRTTAPGIRGILHQVGDRWGFCLQRDVSGVVGQRKLLGAGAPGAEPHGQAVRSVTFSFPLGCKVMVDAGVRLLSLTNQLSAAGKNVLLAFDEGIVGTMGYLNRMGFFDFLLSAIEVTPEKPALSGAAAMRGQSAGLVEFAAIATHGGDRDLPGKLAQALEDNVGQRPDAGTLGHAAFTVFAELIDNIHNHSESNLPGYAALQVYKKGGRVKVAVSDSGLGIIKTLRPVLAATKPALARCSDTDLVVEAFREGPVAAWRRSGVWSKDLCRPRAEVQRRA